MSWIQRDKNGNAGGGGDTTIAVTIPGVVAGDLVCVAVGGFAAGDVASVSDGTSTLTLGTLNTASSEFLRMGYLLSSVASGSVTYTATYTISTLARNIHAWVYTPSAAASFDQERADSVELDTSISSGNITTTGADELVIAASWCETPTSFSSMQINGVAADDSQSGAEGISWVRVVSGTFTGAATATAAASSRIFTNVMSFTLAGGRTFLLNRV